MAEFKPPHCDTTLDYSCERPRVRFAEGGRYVQLSFARSPASRWNDEAFGRLRENRGQCKGFSFGSRRRLLNKLNCVSVAAVMPSFVTMTLPDESYCEDRAEFAKRAKYWMDLWTRRLVRVCPTACGFWRIEWKDRKSGAHEGAYFPHFHLLIWGVPERKTGERIVERGHEQWLIEDWEPYVDEVDPQLSFELLDLWSAGSKLKGELEVGQTRVECLNTGHVFQGRRRFVARCQTLEDRVALAHLAASGQVRQVDEVFSIRKMSLQDWSSLAWYHVVDSHNLDHLQAGVRVERIRSWGGVMWYASKYLSKPDEECMRDARLGRMWGIFNRANVPWAKIIDMELEPEVGVQLRRIARRYLERVQGRRRRVGYGITVYCDVARWRKLWQLADPDPF